MHLASMEAKMVKLKGGRVEHVNNVSQVIALAHQLIHISPATQGILSKA
jgi:hypothetical protein